MRSRLITAAVPLAGVAVCVIAIAAFLLNVIQNTLPWSPRQSVREHYLAVGQSYSQGFMAGFFLCLFLTLAAVVVSGRYRNRRDSDTGESGVVDGRTSPLGQSR